LAADINNLQWLSTSLMNRGGTPIVEYFTYVMFEIIPFKGIIYIFTNLKAFIAVTSYYYHTIVSMFIINDYESNGVTLSSTIDG
jgi:hypothetical protein